MEPLLSDPNNPPTLEPITEQRGEDSGVRSAEQLRESFSKHRLLSALVLPNLDASEVLPENLQARISDYKYWINLVSRLGFDASVYQPASQGFVPSLETLSRYFDSTQLGLLRVFHLFDSDNDQSISVPEIARGLRQQGLYTRQGQPDADSAFRELIDLIASEDGDHAHPPEFLTVLRNLRLAAIVSDRAALSVTSEDLRMNLHEYREDQLYSACPMEHPIEFLFKPNTLASDLALNPQLHAHISKTTHLTGGAPHHVRWLHLHEASKRAILGLAVKYGLDPRFVLDVFTLWREQAKVDQVSTYDMHYGFVASNGGQQTTDFVGAPSVDRPLWFFVVVPVIRLSEYSRDTLRPYQAWRRSIMRQRSARQMKRGDHDETGHEAAAPNVQVIVEHCNLAMFVSGVAEGGTVLSFSSEWVELMRLNTMPKKNLKGDKKCWGKKPEHEKRHTESGGRMPSGTPGSTWNTPFDKATTDVQLTMFNKVLSQIRTSYSRLRTGDAHTFLLKVLCDLTEDYLLIAQAYEACLLILQKRTDTEKDNLNSKEVRRVQKSIMQLSQLYRIVRPVATLADTFSSRQQWSGDAMLYVSDIRSNVSRFLEDVSTSKEHAKSIVEQYNQYSESKTSSVLYTLTLVTTVFVPGQFLTSLYGMNFTYNDQPSIPELTWEHGYLFFWLLLVCITSVTFILYRRQRWI
jgi:Mg2+ and Co2+ transporter CorA